MTVKERGKYRLQTISKMLENGEVESMPISYGLGIEKKCRYNTSDYFVICFVKYNEETQKAVLEETDTNIFDVPVNEWLDFRELIREAILLVDTFNRVKKENNE